MPARERRGCGAPGESAGAMRVGPGAMAGEEASGRSAVAGRGARSIGAGRSCAGCARSSLTCLVVGDDHSRDRAPRTSRSATGTSGPTSVTTRAPAVGVSARVSAAVVAGLASSRTISPVAPDAEVAVAVADGCRQSRGSASPTFLLSVTSAWCHGRSRYLSRLAEPFSWAHHVEPVGLKEREVLRL